MSESFPVGFVAHGAPTLALDEVKGAELYRWAQAMGRPSAILVVSAHWEMDVPALGATQGSVPLLYDFSGFPEELYRLKYACPPAPHLADRVQALLQAEWGTLPRTERGLDHGAWVPLRHMYPQADVPVLQIALPVRHTCRMQIALGRALSALKAEGVLILGSGGLVHNFSHISFSTGAQPEPWAPEFEAWVVEQLNSWDLDTLVNVRTIAPGGKHAIPTWEHFAPLFIAAGEADPKPAVSFPIRGFEYGSLSRTCIEFR